nr:retrovirus-related Pol polyprotein from transposon TNT 1-94 [Tanacetum cinerariifolium]
MIEESKDLKSLSLDELIENLRVHEMFIKKDFKIVKAKGERRSLALKAKKESSDEECLTFRSEDEVYAMVVTSRSFLREDALDAVIQTILSECLKPPKEKNRRAFVGGSWSDRGEEDDEKDKYETCLMAQASSEVHSKSSYFSDENSSIDNFVLDNTTTYILNRILIRAILGKTPYELLRGRKPTLDYFKVFRRKLFILNTKDNLTKFDPKSYEGVFLSYSQNSKAYVILNKHTRKIEESLNVTFDETPPPSKTSPLVDGDLDEDQAIKVAKKKAFENDIENETLEIDEIVNI